MGNYEKEAEQLCQKLMDQNIPFIFLSFEKEKNGGMCAYNTNDQLMTIMLSAFKDEYLKQVDEDIDSDEFVKIIKTIINNK